MKHNTPYSISCFLMLILCLLHPNEFESTRNFGSSLGGADPSHTKSRIEVVLSPQRTTVQCRPRIVSCVANPKKDDHVLLVRALKCRRTKGSSLIGRLMVQMKSCLCKREVSSVDPASGAAPYRTRSEYSIYSRTELRRLRRPRATTTPKSTIPLRNGDDESPGVYRPQHHRAANAPQTDAPSPDRCHHSYPARFHLRHGPAHPQR